MPTRIIPLLLAGLFSTAAFAAVANATQPTSSTQTARKATAPAAAIAPGKATLPTAKALTSPAVTGPTQTPIQNEKDKVSYAIGMDMGTNLKSQSIEVNPDMLAKGVKDALAGDQPLVSPQEMANTLANLQKQIITKREADFKMQADKNKRAGDAFLQSNKTKPGVVTLNSGLEYKVIKQGNGAQPTDKDTVTVNYVGSLLNGQEFDSSYRRGKPVTFPVAEMIPGWSEVLRLMKAGSTWEVYIPAHLAYGERGLPGGPIGPNQALIFKIELISVTKKK